MAGDGSADDCAGLCIHVALVSVQRLAAALYACMAADLASTRGGDRGLIRSAVGGESNGGGVLIEDSEFACPGRHGEFDLRSFHCRALRSVERAGIA